MSDMYFMNEKSEFEKLTGFAEMPKCEIQVDPKIDFKRLDDYECKIELSLESKAEWEELQEQLDAEIIENLQQQIKAVDDVIAGLKCYDELKICPEHCPYYSPTDNDCSSILFKDTIAIAEAYKRVVESGLKMMESR